MPFLTPENEFQIFPHFQQIKIIALSEPGWLTYLVIGITNKLHHPNNENSSPLHEEHALNAQSVARLVAQVFHFLHSCATICGRATVTLGRASLII